MSALLDYVNDIIRQAYHDGTNLVAESHVVLMRPEDARDLIAAELESGAWDEYLAEFYVNAGFAPEKET